MRPGLKAILFREYGGPELLEWAETEKPVPGPEQILVRVRAAAVNPLDWHFLRGTPYGFRLGIGLSKPRDPRLGMDFAGEVEAAGSRVTRFQPGDEVFGGDRGAYAEYLCVPEKAAARKPANVTFEQAAATPVAGLTAMQALRDYGKLQPGHAVLVHGASGGVGTFVIQEAKQLGARVTAVCSTRNLDLVRDLGAESAIDYKREDFTKSGRRFDLIVDCVGDHSLADCRRVLGRHGRYVMVGAPPGRWVSPMDKAIAARLLSIFVPQTMTWMSAKMRADDLNVLAGWLASGAVMPLLDRTWPIAKAAEAIRYVETRRARGKVVLVAGAGS